MIGILAEPVEVVSYTVDGLDDLNSPVKAPHSETVSVLVVPGGQSATGEDNRPEGRNVAYTLYFPKSFTGDLDGCDVVVRGHRCRVVGHADRYRVYDFMEYDMKCEVEHVEG